MLYTKDGTLKHQNIMTFKFVTAEASMKIALKGSKYILLSNEDSMFMNHWNVQCPSINNHCYLQKIAWL